MAIPYTSVDLSLLPPPNVVETLDFETIFKEMLSELVALDATYSALVESDPGFKLLQVAAYRELLLRQRVNDATKAVMLAYATGSDLDQIAANYGIIRLLITPADNTTIPPTPAVYESDADLRFRTGLALEAYSTAGSIGAYTFHALSASGDCKYVAVKNITPGTVNVAILSRTGSGAAPDSTLSAVESALSAETVRPVADTVVVTSARVLNYTITAVLDLYSVVGKDEVLSASINALRSYEAEQHRLGRDITLSGLYAALHVPGVKKVIIISPLSDIVVKWDEVAYCVANNVTIGQIGE